MRRSWTTRAPCAYDVLMAPIEALGLERMRAAMWAGVPRHGLGLEVGSGSGAGLPHRPDTARLVGSDLSVAMLDRAREHGDAAPLVAADVQALPFRDGMFDWATGSLLFCEVPEPELGLSELHRVLRPGGTLHLLEHVRPDGAVLGFLADALTRVTAPLLGEHFDRATVESVAQVGFRIERVERRLRGGLVHLVARRTNDAEEAA